LLQIPMRILNHIPLLMQVRQRARANLLRFERDTLALVQSLAATAKTLGAGEKLLALLELGIMRVGRLVGVTVAEKGFAVVREGLELAR
jgi:hypothetical protein